MKNVLVFFALFLCVFVPKTQAQDIYLDPCMRLCAIHFSDNSGSMDTAISDVHRRARNMVLIPRNGGYAEIGLVSFGVRYEVLCEPTADRKTFLDAVDTLVTRVTENDTRPHYGLEYLRGVFQERKEADSTEVQVLHIHSDYDWYDPCESMKVIEGIISDGVIVILSLPAKYDGHGQGEKRMINEENLKQIEDLGCLNIRSSFPLFKRFWGKLQAIVPCG
ncbi:MAG: VWA domain-containing protein [Candidatus Pacebacteria bacterium]|nr:VWA domain-containing protein [Candidatus Paceibacterota bacterium]